MSIIGVSGQRLAQGSRPSRPSGGVRSYLSGFWENTGAGRSPMAAHGDPTGRLEIITNTRVTVFHDRTAKQDDGNRPMQMGLGRATGR